MTTRRHDQNFKNLILDYPQDAIAFFAPTESEHSAEPGVRIVPVREEQLKENLHNRHRELDIPLLVEWPDGRRAALLFVFEEETQPRRFSVHRLAHYCLDLAELFETERVVPVVIFLYAGSFARALRLGGDHADYLSFRFLYLSLHDTPARDHLSSPNLVARLNLPNMRYAPEEKLAVYASATRGLNELECDPDKRLKYLDFIDIYAALDENESTEYQRQYPEETAIMSSLSQRLIEQGIEKGIEKGIAKGIAKGIERGEANMLSHMIELKFGPEAVAAHTDELAKADAETLRLWSKRFITAESPDDVFTH